MWKWKFKKNFIWLLVETRSLFNGGDQYKRANVISESHGFKFAHVDGTRKSLGTS